MLKRSVTQTSQAYHRIHPSERRKSNPYLSKLQSMKQQCKSATIKPNHGYDLRKSSGQVEHQFTKESLDSKRGIKTAQNGQSTELSSPLFVKINKQIQSNPNSSAGLRIQQQFGEVQPRNQELLQSTIAHLSQFIEYFLQNSLIKAEMNRNSELEMQKNPLQTLIDKIQVSKLDLERQKCENVRTTSERILTEERVKKQIEQIDSQNENINIQILQLINSHTEHRNLLKTIGGLQKKILQTRIKQNFKLEEAESNIKGKILFYTESNAKINDDIEEMKNQIHVITNLRENLNRIEEDIIINKKARDESLVVYKELIKQKSTKDIKEQLTSNVKSNGNLFSNKTILENFFKSLDTKHQIIKNAVITHSESHQFLTSLELKQSQQPGQLKITSLSNLLTPDESGFLQANKSEFDVYDTYLKTDSQIKRIEVDLDSVYERYQKNLNFMEAEAEKLKLVAADQLKHVRELENIEAIRQAQIQQLNEILSTKKQQLNKAKSEKSSFEIFRNSLAGFSTISKA